MVIIPATNTIGVMSGAECYHSLKINFQDICKEINEVISEGQVELSPGENVPVDIFLGGDYKVFFLYHNIFTPPSKNDFFHGILLSFIVSFFY